MKKGQVLLITVMVFATILTVVLGVSFRSATETQVSKLEEENQKALAAAEAAVEAALNSETGSATLGSGSLSQITDYTGTAALLTTTQNNFTTSLLPKDGSYTFYLGDYNITTHEIGASTGQSIEVCFKSGSPNPAIEITLVKAASLIKYVVDPDGRIANATSPSSCSNTSFNYAYTVPGGSIGADGKVLVVKNLYQETRLYFKRTSAFPLQGKTVMSEAVSTTGVSKKVTLFQSYPQIPAEFFNTAF